VTRVFYRERLGVPMDESADTDLQRAVEQFLSEADGAFEEYDRGYTDTDATLRRLEGAIEGLRAATRDE
jgi:hypothetical protein